MKKYYVLLGPDSTVGSLDGLVVFLTKTAGHTFDIKSAGIFSSREATSLVKQHPGSSKVERNFIKDCSTTVVLKDVLEEMADIACDQLQT